MSKTEKEVGERGELSISIKGDRCLDEMAFQMASLGTKKCFESVCVLLYERIKYAVYLFPQTMLTHTETAWFARMSYGLKTGFSSQVKANGKII